MNREVIHLFNKVVFAENLRAARARLDMSQNEFADKVGISPTQLMRYENEQQIPGVDKMLAICKVAGLTPNELLGWS